VTDVVGVQVGGVEVAIIVDGRDEPAPTVEEGEPGGQAG